MTDINGMYNALLAELLKISSTDKKKEQLNQMTNLIEMLYDVLTIAITVTAGGILMRAKLEQATSDIERLLAAVRDLETSSKTCFQTQLRTKILLFAAENQTPNPFSNPEAPAKPH